MNTRLFKEMSTKWAKKHKKYQCRAETEHLPQPPQNYNRNSNKSQNEVFLKFLLQSALCGNRITSARLLCIGASTHPHEKPASFTTSRRKSTVAAPPFSSSYSLMLQWLTWGISATTQEYRFLKFDADSLRSFSPGLWTPIREQTVWHFCW